MDDSSLAGETSAKKKESMSSVSGGAKKAPEPRMVRGTKGTTLNTTPHYYISLTSENEMSKMICISTVNLAHMAYSP